MAIYQKTTWINNNEPAINGTNLNKIEQGIYDNSVAVDTLEGLLNNHTVRADVPSNAVFTDTTYEAGANIQINQGVISATDTTYSVATANADGLMSSSDYSKLSGIESGAEANVQSDFSVTDDSSDAYIKNKPTLGTASALDVALSGNASTTQVVKGDDTRLTDSRPASDVSAWAKASTKPSYEASEIAYANTTSGLTATDVQGAIDEIDGSVDAIEKNTKHLTNAVLHDFAPILEIDAYGVDAGDVKVKIEPVQSGSGNPSPYNPRPISGWSKVNVSAAGKNLIFKKIENCNIGTGGNLQSNNDYDVFVALIKKGITYFPTTGSGSFIYTLFTDEPSMGSVSYTGTRYVDGEEAYTATIDGFIAFRTTKANTGVAQFEKGYAATTHEDFKGKLYTIDLDGTRYGGVLDVTSGVLTVDRAIGTLDGSQSFTITGDGKCFYTDAFNGLGKHIAGNTGQVNAIMSAFVNETSSDKVRNNLTANAFNIGSNYFSSGCRLAFSNTSGWDGTQITNYFTNNPATIVYELATPITVQLSPVVVKLLQGYNNLSADSGDISVDVFSLVESVSRVEDEVAVKVVISALGTDESGNATASRAYTAGEFFYKDGKMYKVTANIASGEAFTEGTNISETTLFAELTALA